MRVPVPRPYDVTLLTCDAFPELAPDDRLLAAALAAKGLRVRAAVWSDPEVDWSASELVLVRSPWDYFHRLAAFRVWVEHAAGCTRLVNPPATLLWNLDKLYLRDLAAAGIATVPSLFWAPGEPVDAVLAQAEERGWREVVLKPTVSGGAFGTRRFHLPRGAAAAAEHLASLPGDRGAILQPYLAAVESARERALVFIGGAFSHAVRKAPFNPGALGGEDAEVPHAAEPGEIAFAERVIAASGGDFAYARVDLVPTDEGPQLMELEVFEAAA